MPISHSSVNIVFFTYLVFCAVVTAGAMVGELTFGYGLGDLGMLFMLFTSLVVSGILVAAKYRMTNLIAFWNVIVAIVIVLFALYFLLLLTIWRGPEHAWQGSL